MKKVLVILVLAFSMVLSQAFADSSDITIKVNGQVIKTDVKPYINSENRTVVPIRVIAEALGASVDWDDSSKTVTIKKDSSNIVLKIGESKALVNGTEKVFDTKAVIKDSRTFVPLRFVSETLGAEVTWLANSRIVLVTLYKVDNVFEEINKKIPNTTIKGETLFYSSQNSSNPSSADWIVFNDESKTIIGVNSYSDNSLANVKELLKFYYPTEYDKAYQKVIETINGNIKKDGLVYVGEKGVFDGKNFESVKFEEGTTIYIGG